MEEAKTKKPVVLLISMDAIRPDYLDWVHLFGAYPFEQYGIRAKSLTPVFPTNLFPTHASLITGAWPSQHGIVNDRFLDARRGYFHEDPNANWLAAEPLWAAAERQGIKTAVFGWPGSRGAYRGIEPTFTVPPSREKEHERGKVNQIAEWYRLPQDETPQLIIAYFKGTDAAAHQHGPDDPNVLRSLKQQDVQIQRLHMDMGVRKAWYHTTMIVVSGHGMALATEAIDVGTPLREKGLNVLVPKGGGAAVVYLEKPEQRDEALEILRAQANIEAYPSDEFLKGYNAYQRERSGEIIVTVDPPYVLWDPGPDPEEGIPTGRVKNIVRGAHGYRPEDEKMQGIFMAVGRGVERRKDIGIVRTIDVAATVANLLGIDPPEHSQGRALLDPNIQFEIATEVFDLPSLP